MLQPEKDVMHTEKVTERDFFQHRIKHLTFIDRFGRQQEMYCQVERLNTHKGEIGHWTQTYATIKKRNQYGLLIDVNVPVITFVVNGKIIQPFLEGEN